MKKSAIFLAAILYLAGVTAHAQSLGDLAREEKKRREAVSGRITTIENIPSTVPMSTPGMGALTALTDEEFDRQMAEAANEFNKYLPIRINSEITLYAAAPLPNKTIMYFYTLVNYSMDDLNFVDVEEFKNQTRQGILNEIKINPGLRLEFELLRNSNVTLISVLNGNDGRELFRISFNYDDIIVETEHNTKRKRENISCQ